MRVIVTRPRADAEALAARLAARGIDCIVQPLIDIVPLRRPAPDLAGVQAVLATSANGVRALARATAERAIAVFAVGDASAEAARAAGFRRVESAGGDAGDLAALAIRRLDPAAGALCHVAGSAVAGDLAGRLEAAGFAVRREVLYEARPAARLSAETVAAVRHGGADGALFFSPRTASAFVRLAREAGLGDACRALDAYCLSPAVAAAAGALRWRRVAVAPAPTQDALLRLLPAGAGGDA